LSRPQEESLKKSHFQMDERQHHQQSYLAQQQQHQQHQQQQQQQTLLQQQLYHQQLAALLTAYPALLALEPQLALSLQVAAPVPCSDPSCGGKKPHLTPPPADRFRLLAHRAARSVVASTSTTTAASKPGGELAK